MDLLILKLYGSGQRDLSSWFIHFFNLDMALGGNSFESRGSI